MVGIEKHINYGYGLLVGLTDYSTKDTILSMVRL